MTKLDTFFRDNDQKVQHPLVRYLTSDKFDSIKVSIVRADNILGFKPAKLILIVVKDSKDVPPMEYEWDDELNAALVELCVQAVSLEDEKVRFGLSLRSAFKRPETRYGVGFFNSVLIEFVRDSEFREFKEVADVLQYVHTNKPYNGGGTSYGDCRAMIEEVIHGRAKELTEKIKYPQDEAAKILAGAMARYIDERFTVSDRKRMGWV